MMRYFLPLVLLAGLLIGAPRVCAQSIDVTFRWIPQPGDGVVRAFLPGEFNNWGPNSNGQIAPSATSLMRLDSDLNQWLYTVSLQVGRTYQYKVHLHFDEGGQRNSWISDPLHARINTNDNNNSVVTIQDPMIFQMGRRQNSQAETVEVSAGILGSEAITELTFEINHVTQDGMPFFRDGIFRYVLPEPAACGLQFALAATDAQGRVVRAEVGVVPPAVQERGRPAMVQDGVTYHEQDASRATLSLFAPGKCFVHVIGDFNDWEADDAFLMWRDTANGDSVHWWLELDDLEMGEEYAYQYLVDGELRIADLFSEKLLDPGHDQHIPEATYPDLKPYPEGKTTGMVSVLQTGQQPYVWTATDYTPPPQGELVIYELLIRDFVAAHDYRTLIDTLDYLERLGVNAIELMPVAEFGGNVNWGYQPQFYFSPDKYYGPREDFQRFVDAAHGRGMAVILDVVYNHVDFPSPLISLYGATDANPWINIPAHHAFNVFFDINHEDSYTQYWLDRVNAHWLTQYNVDGFRFDLSKGITQRDTYNNAGAGSAYDASRVALLTRMARHIWAVKPGAYVILEHFAADREERVLAETGRDEGLPGMMVWNNLNDPYAEAVMGYHADGRSDFSRSYYGSGGKGWDVPHAISYMESHDEQWLMYKMLQYGACAQAPQGGVACEGGEGDYNVRHRPVALDRMKMAGAFFLLLPGPRMLWQFGELGYGFGDRGEECLRPSNCPPFAPARTGSKPIRWDYRIDPLRAKLYETWAALLGLRREHTVFRSTDTQVELDVRGTVKRVRLSHPSMEVEIIGNFGVQEEPNTLRLSAPPRYWYDYFSGEPLDVTGSRMPMLQPGEFHVYTSRRLDSPRDGLITVATEAAASHAGSLSLLQNYPNPFGSSTRIQFTLPVAGAVLLEVFDVLGRRIALLVDESLAARTHAVDFETGGLSAGVYLYRLQTSSGVESRSMMHVR